MCQCHQHHSCHGCHHAVDRRRFLQGFGAAAAATAGSLSSLSSMAADAPGKKARVALVFLDSMNAREIWPYPDFDTKKRRQEVLAALRKGCPEVEFIPVDAKQAAAMKDEVDGYLIYTMTLVWGQGGQMTQIAQLGKPTLVADEFLGGSGVFLTSYSRLCSRKIPAAGVSTTRLEELATVARQFAKVGKDTTPAAFEKQCEEVYRKTFGARGDMKCAEDKLTLTGIGECVKRFRDSTFLIVGRGKPGREQDFLGTKGRYLDFSELTAFYEKADKDKAAEWAKRWTDQGTKLPAGDYVDPRVPTPEAVQKAGGIYLAILELLKKYGTDNITMNCLGGFSSGKLPSYPCLGFMQLLNDGGQGVCEAMPDDTLSMMMARILTGRPGFVSDPALDTAKNQIVYAHCVGTTKPFGPKGASNDYHIRTLHNRDPRGACSESLLPAGYMTTSFRTNFGRKQMIIHQAKALGPLDTERGCRTKLIGEPTGDIGKLFDQWDQFGWHRVTVYGDVKEPLCEFGKALGLKIIEEA